MFMPRNTGSFNLVDKAGAARHLSQSLRTISKMMAGNSKERHYGGSTHDKTWGGRYNFLNLRFDNVHDLRLVQNHTSTVGVQ